MLLSKELYTDSFWFRVVLAIGAIVIPLFGVIMKHELPNCTEYMSHRLIMSIVWLAVLILSLTNSFFKKWLITITCWLFFILNIWAVWIVFINNFAIIYCTGLLTAFCAMNITYYRPKLYYPFFIATILVSVVACWMCPEPEISFYVFAFTITVLGVVFMLTCKTIIDTQKKLNELNLTLEKKVAERTAEAENKSKLLISKNKELEQFAYIASHDLKSPLRNIGGFTQLIQRKLKKYENDEVEEYMGLVLNNVNKMDRIINDILLYSRFGTESIPFEKTEIGEMVRGVCSFMDHEITVKNGAVRCNNLCHEIYCNASQLSQLFQNLIDNGLKYNEMQQPVIDISMTEKQAEYLFSVKDNGIGIQHEFKERIFKIFQRLHSDEKYSGTGIGLAICKRIVENHGGEIWIESIPNVGTTFFFTISKKLVPGFTPKSSKTYATGHEILDNRH